MIAGNLSIEHRKWTVKQYWKTENSERVRTAWVEEPSILYYIVYTYFWPTLSIHLKSLERYFATLVVGRSPADIVGSNPTGSIDVYPL